jgi:peptide/nickel transport system substrate-binding protein
MRTGWAVAAMAWLAVQSPAGAAEARLGVQTETGSIDPHFAVVGANQTIAQHIFESLLAADESMHPAPGLAASWKLVGDDVWEFRIRSGAKFHDGAPVTAEDVRFSLERMPHVPNSPAPFVRLAGSIRAIETEGTDVIRLRTKGFDPSVPLNAMTAWIVSEKAARDVTTADFNSGRAAIGSGPWRFVEWKPGERLVLERADPAMAFDRVVIRPMASDAARLAALLSGDVDLIDSVPTEDVDQLHANKAVKLWTAPSARLIYLAVDQEHDTHVQLRGIDGQKLKSNPLKDARVRRALSLAINRNAIVERILHGAGKATGQMVPQGFVGYDPGIPVPAYDPAMAKRLLAEAGWGQGFKLTLTSPNNRYVADATTAQAVAQQWSRVGVTTDVDVLPSNAFFSRGAKREFAAFLIGFGSSAGDAYPAMSQVLNTFDTEKGLGALNRFRFSDPAVDAALAASNAERDPAKREAALRGAARKALVEDVAIIPLHFPDNAWATRTGFSYRPTMSEGAQAGLLRPAE